MTPRHAIAFALLAWSGSSTLASAQQTPADMAGKREVAVTPRSFRWMRTITPPQRAPKAEACVVLDADTFSHAAPALRDLRLYQDGVELPYVVEQSFDERALDSGTTPPDDRSLYEASASGTLQPLPANETVAGQPMFRASILLPAHVPVERVRVENAPAAPALLGVRAAITVPSLLGGGAETTQGTVTAEQPALPFTIGADLQSPAEVTVMLTGTGVQPGRVLLEMRRRSLCYQPESASPLTLYLGAADVAAESYPFARAFQSETERPTAALGALTPNPEFHERKALQWHLSRRGRIVLALLLFVFLFLLNVRRRLGKAKGK